MAETIEKHFKQTFLKILFGNICAGESHQVVKITVT
jgi:hypothetical protein